MRPTLFIALLFALSPALLAADAPAKRPNVLFIAVDDLRPQLGCYGDAIAKTPNLDRLASQGVLFNRAYCQQAVCSPSRTSLLTGRRPDTTKIYNLEDHFRTTIPDVVTLPQHFKNNGYHAQAFGKIYHGALDDPASWSMPAVGVQAPSYSPEVMADIRKRQKEMSATNKKLTKRQLNRLAKGPAWQIADVADNALNDGSTADNAIKALGEIAGKDTPFFLAVGFIKPHLPFVAPKKYFDLYPPAEQIPLPPDMKRPAGAPELAFTNFAELRNYQGMPDDPTPVSDQQARELIRGYYAATSYMDAQVGRVIAELERLGQRENTIVILWGDHGWHLGENGMWCKHTNFENAARAALMISPPTGGRGVGGASASAASKRGVKTDALVEFVDIYPTLSELAGLPAPNGVEGTSFVPLLSDPTRAWKSAAFSQFPREGEKVMGYSIRTDRYRYTEWQERATGKVVATELYDHQSDPRETKNVAAAPDNAAAVKQLAQALKDGWKAATPPKS